MYLPHMMIDLETWGTAPGSAIRSIGAVTFDLNGNLGETFYRNIEDDSCVESGLVRDESTVRWWSNQEAAAQEALLVDQCPLAKVISDFNKFWTVQRAKFPWSHGAGFDLVLWEAACRATRSRTPWKFWDCRDTRTLFALADFTPQDIAFEGTKHNALDDAIHQAKCVQRAYARLRGRMV